MEGEVGVGLEIPRRFRVQRELISTERVKACRIGIGRSVGSRTEFCGQVFGPAGGIVVGSGFGITGEATEREMVRRQNRSEVEEEELRATGGREGERERVGLSSSVVLQALSGTQTLELERGRGSSRGDGAEAADWRIWSESGGAGQ